MAIVTVPGPTGGAGAAVTVAQIVNAMWANSQERTSQSTAYLGQALNLAGTAPHMDVPVLDSAYEAPTAPTLPEQDPNAAERVYDTKRREMETLLKDGFSGFLDKYFPVDASFQQALNWISRALTTGGAGINVGVEQALWQRAKGRVLGDTERAKAELMATWAGKRFPVPPGALVNAVNQLNVEAGRKLADVSREAAIKSFDAEVENARLAVREALDLRLKAVDAAGSYIKTLILGPQTAVQLATGIAGIQTEFARSLVQMYSAQVTAAEPAVRLAIAQGDLTARAGAANLNAESGLIDARVKSVLAAAQMLGSQASAGINAINAQASISGSDSSSV